MSFINALRLIWPLSQTKKAHLKELSLYLGKQDVTFLKKNLKLKTLGVSYDSLKINKSFAKNQAYPQINQATTDKELHTQITLYNSRIKKQIKEQAFHEFKSNAKEVFPKIIAPHLIGMDDAKKVAIWQLFSKERFHILLLGDPGTGKTDLLRAAAQFAPISSFGLGSGTSGVGLSAAKKGKELIKGLLPRANHGVACIDELNLMKVKDRGALLNAMEKGFITYDKGTTHQQLEADVRILATANPKGDRFIGNKVSFLKKQLPFDPALLSRFHIVFFIRRPSKDEFRTITKNLLTKDHKSLSAEDVSFIKEYITFIANHEVKFSKKLEPIVTNFFDNLKDKEDDYLVELSPRLVLGVVRMAKAAARMQGLGEVSKDLVKEVLVAFDQSLKIATDTASKKK